MNILVTGATGFIGSHVVKSLVQQGHAVTALVRRPAGPVERASGLRFVIADLTRPQSLVDAFAGQDAIVHCAGKVGGPGGWPEYHEAVVRGTRNAVEEAARAGVQRFVQMSSLAVCIPPGPGGRLTGRSPCAAHPPDWNHYARAKIGAERAVRVAHDEGRIRAVILRPGIVFGPGDRQATPMMLRALSFPFRFEIGDGMNPVACLAVEDLAGAVSAAVMRSGIEGRCYALAGRRIHRQHDLFEIHARFAHLEPPRRSMSRHRALRLGAAIERLGSVFRFEPPLTRFGVWVMSAESRVDDPAAATDLGFTGETSCADAVARGLAGLSAPCGADDRVAAAVRTTARRAFR